MTGPPGNAAADPAPAAAKPERARGRDGARFWELWTWGFCSDLVQLANKQGLTEHDATYLMPKRDYVQRSAAEFDACYQRLQAAQGPRPAEPKEPGVFNATFRALCILHWREMVLGSVWTATEVAIRLLGPVILRQFLRWLQAYAAGQNPDPWRGWLLAVALGASGFAMALMHHQLFWSGMHMGFLMRQQCIAAIHSKVLRLNSAAIAHVSSGHVVNLVSNDVRRFDDAMPYWMFLWAGPLELAMVFLMVSLELGVLPALAGVASTLLLIPVQAALVRPVGKIRQNTAARTDERVRLASEAIQGSLAMKMLSWERPITHALCSIREREASWIHKMARIRATNNALYFAITPVVAFATFAVYRALNGALNVPSVFYALSLLLLPKLYMVLFFITGVQSFTELVVSLKRIDTFLNMEEPPAAQRLLPPPPQVPPQAGVGAAASTPPTGIVNASDDKALAAGGGLTRGVVARVALRGADYDWARPMGHAQVASHAAGQAGALAASGAAGSPAGGGHAPASGAAKPKPSHDGRRSGSLELGAATGPTLRGIEFELRPGELLGVTGEVGSGKSSMLAALLGELLPLPSPGRGAAAPLSGPTVAGTAAKAAAAGAGLGARDANRPAMRTHLSPPRDIPPEAASGPSLPGKALQLAPSAPPPSAVQQDRDSAPGSHSGPSIPGKPGTPPLASALASAPPLAKTTYVGTSFDNQDMEGMDSAPGARSGPSIPGRPLMHATPPVVYGGDRDSAPGARSGPSVPGRPLSLPPPQPVESERGSRDSGAPLSGPSMPGRPTSPALLSDTTPTHTAHNTAAAAAAAAVGPHSGMLVPGKSPLPPHSPPMGVKPGVPLAAASPGVPPAPPAPPAPAPPPPTGKAQHGWGTLQEVHSGPSVPGGALSVPPLATQQGDRDEYSAPYAYSGPSLPGRSGLAGGASSGEDSLANLPHVMLDFSPKAEDEQHTQSLAPFAAGAGEPQGQGQDDGRGPVLCGRVAYCGQIPWIVSGTVRDNIVFDSAWDEGWYCKVVKACALEQDFKDLAAGDMTELGERGINLSGGQKARVALARCCYSQADVQLLDDPLSAVDPRVGRLLFGEAISKLMKGSMRILVTHQRQVLPRCDRVMVLRGGRVVALGTFAEVSALGLPELTAGAHTDNGAASALAEASVDELTAAGDEAAEGDGMEDEGQEEEVPQAKVAHTDQGVQGSGGSNSTGAAGASAGSRGGSGEAASLPLAVVSKGVEGEGTLVGAGQAAGKRLPSELTKARLPSSHTFAWFRGGNGKRGGGGGSGDDGFEEGDELAGDGEAREEEEEEGLEKDAPGRMASAGRIFARGRSFGTGLLRLVSLKEVVGRSKGKGLDAVDEEGGGEGEGTDAPANKGQLVQAEGRQSGTTPVKVYVHYAKAIGVCITTLIWLMLFAGQAVYLAADWWLALWSRIQPAEQANDSWLWVYGLLTALVIVISFIRAFIFFEYTVEASTTVHNQITTRVLKAPLSFFHTNPTGRILNRFSKDLAQVDDLLPMTMYDSLQTGFGVLSAFLLVAIAVPVILPVFLPLVAAFYWLRIRYVKTSREIKRWEAVARSPVFASFSASLKGLPTIRAFSSQRRFHAAFLEQLQANGEWFYAFMVTARWIGFRLDIISATTLLASALLAMAIRDTLNSSILALALTYILQLTGYLQWFVRQTAEVENHMTALERLVEYTSLPQEPADVDQGGAAPPKGWPASGTLQYDRVTAVYRPGLPPVLQDVSFELQGGSSCGLVGRTGSGKSSLMLTLFRLIDVTSGTIYLDGLNVASIGLDALRAQLAIIPQDPVLFSGTIRSNLDPWNKHPDSALWEVLSAVKLNKAVGAAGGLHTRMQEAGDNLSVGQRQLFCLARALLQDARVLALDEATANVDRGTDQLIQQALRDFAHADPKLGRVLLVIAHRLDTIIDMDHLLVLSAGELVEQGSPQQLCEQQGGLFAGMVAAAAVGALPQK